jgi:hypothetical protein
MTRLSVTCATWLALAGCTAEVNTVSLVVPPGGATGLACVDTTTADGAPLAARTIVGPAEAAVTVVTDFVAADGVSSGRPGALLRFCDANECPVLVRDCREVAVEVEPGTTAGAVQRLVQDALAEGGPITTDAPDGVVVIRVVLTTQPCADATFAPGAEPPPFARDALAGCFYSSPLQLDGVRGEVELELDTFGGSCTDETVCLCANVGLDYATACGL